MIYIPAKTISYSAYIRDLRDIKAIVIHYTGVKGDTAVNEGNYFANSNNREAGAHFFVDRYGTIVKSVRMKYAAWAVGGSKYPSCSQTGGGTAHGLLTNDNTVSIELCDIIDQYPSKKQIKAVRRLVKYIRKYCPNAKTIVRHFDITGKLCPATMCAGLGNLVWMKFLKDIKEIK